MKQLLTTLFSHSLPETDRRWYHVIGWWEIRRIVFNVTLLVTGIISILCMTFVVKGAGDFVSGLSIIAFAFIANFFYTLGWVIELFLRLVKNRNATWFGLKSFKVGFIVSVCASFIPTLIFGIGGLINGELFSSPYSHFATTEPQFNNLVGTYKFDFKNSTALEGDDKNLKPEIVLNDDGTFTATNFPESEMFSYVVCNGSGKWRLNKDVSFNAWAILVSYDTMINVKTNKPMNKAVEDYYIYNNKPPYKIYCITGGDPDSWMGFIFEK